MRFENGTRHELFTDISVKAGRKERRYEQRKKEERNKKGRKH
jgi:hypothetical protein